MIHKTVILPHQNTPPHQIEQLAVSSSIYLGTTSGKNRAFKEDRLGYSIGIDGSIRFCIADGHWGDAAADLATRYWMDLLDFPRTKSEAIKHTKNVEKTLYDRFGFKKMDPESDFTPETSFIAMELKDSMLTMVSYGDCRLLLIRDNQPIFQNQLPQTWLGAFSALGLRDRLSVSSTAEFRRIKTIKEDIVLLYTDGVDQCVYEVDTISINELVQLSALKSPTRAFTDIMSRVDKAGSEDNASLAVIHVK